ncbi:MAG: homoserine dehydrogenase [Candidatus Nitrosocosmicus sp.]|jgi:homoserine dehydrogenase|uniref:homoserine dehydrogenase n=1 Tax=Candidatus Nitrosocosmicus agrestis TaxID=2563600 RepID=UPI00122E7A5D|nr:homoserine dehydrogenase [Candidatus Nitrosocosmicus sp. SS]KAA2279873.1 homoserine dehydrogenase [Candidatus Nitrosocosmicus sp. SS]KAF0870401.1 homoserine dehydrogenase [Candidatus Nitrosocosmicus sp. SS]MDR4491127.1 homoserine dehydrogenase [Candidatus Nitrosocosmicus sp.]
MRIIVCGMGVVGQSFLKLLISSAGNLYKNYGIKPRVVACIDSKGIAYSPTGLDINEILAIKQEDGNLSRYKSSLLNSDNPIEDIDAEVFLELTPTNLSTAEPGLSHIIAALRSKKNVITVNKGPLALSFSSLIELSEYNNAMFRFSGTVGGGTPVLEFAKHCLKGDKITSFEGILNGTTNYILSRMADGLPFAEALLDAKNKGYAETNPSLDIDGDDAAAKLVIMANWIMGYKVTLKDVDKTGITDIDPEEFIKAAKEKKAIKLIAKCNNKELFVKPIAIQKDDPIYVNGTLNAVTFKSEHSGEQTIIGKGAGGMETASSILRDLIEIKQSMLNYRTV